MFMGRTLKQDKKGYLKRQLDENNFSECLSAVGADAPFASAQFKQQSSFWLLFSAKVVF